MVEIVPANSSGRADPSGEEADGGITIERREKYSAVCKWLIPNFSKLKQRTTRCLWSKYFEVGATIAGCWSTQQVSCLPARLASACVLLLCLDVVTW